MLPGGHLSSALAFLDVCRHDFHAGRSNGQPNLLAAEFFHAKAAEPLRFWLLNICDSNWVSEGHRKSLSPAC